MNGTDMRQAGTATFGCSGCDATESAAIVIEVTYEYIGSGIGKVTTRRPQLADMTPEGWMVGDPYTHCTYCPECWAGIGGEVEL